MLVGSLTFADLTVAASSTNAADTVLSITATGEYLTTITDLVYGYIGTNDFSLDVNNAPTNLALSSNSFLENASGATVGTLSASDADGDTLTYSITSADWSHNFEISGTTLKLKDNIFLNYESVNAIDLTIVVTDGSFSSLTS